MLFHSETDVLLSFDAIGTGDRDRQELRAIVTFDLCFITRFGYPNDEALGGHPLAKRGLRWYGVFEIIGSSWAAELAARNRISFPNSSSDFGRHFIFTFHDSTFECLARGLTTSFHPNTANEPFIEQCLSAIGRNG